MNKEETLKRISEIEKQLKVTEDLETIQGLMLELEEHIEFLIGYEDPDRAFD